MVHRRGGEDEARHGLIWHVPQASRACLGRALNARRRTPPAEGGRAPHADTLPAALGPTLPLPDDVVPLFAAAPTKPA